MELSHTDTAKKHHEMNKRLPEYFSEIYAYISYECGLLHIFFKEKRCRNVDDIILLQGGVFEKYAIDFMEQYRNDITTFLEDMKKVHGFSYFIDEESFKIYVSDEKADITFSISYHAFSFINYFSSTFFSRVSINHFVVYYNRYVYPQNKMSFKDMHSEYISKKQLYDNYIKECEGDFYFNNYGVRI